MMKADETVLPVSRGCNRRDLLAGVGVASILAFCSPSALWAQNNGGGLEQFAGRSATRNGKDYEPWRQSMIWQYRKSDRHPEIIIQANSIDDVCAAVKLAADLRKKITTRAGGHSMSACFLRDDGILLDVSRLQEVRLAPNGQEVIVGPGVIGRALNEYLRPHNLAVATAHCGMVPVSGFWLGGGVAWNGNAWGGMAVFNINGVDIVTADGELRHASSTENADLFWAVRGAGPGLFGVVVRFYVKCYPLPKSIQSTEYIYHLSDIVEVAKAVEEIGSQVADNVELLTIVAQASPEHAEKCQGVGCDQAVYVNAIVFGDSVGEAQEKLAPLHNHPIVQKAIGSHPMKQETFESLYTANERSFAQKRWQADNVMTDRADKIAELLLESVPNCPTDNNAAVLVYKGNPRFPDAAYGIIGKFYLAYYMVWDDAADDLAVAKYHVDYFKKAKKYSNGSYLNEFNQEGRPEDLPLCFTSDAWDKLKGLRRKWDPNSVFHNFYGQQ